MARKTEEETQKTRDLILDAAEFVFSEKGITNTAMADIAHRAGVSRGAIYGHYKNKIEVALAMCRRALDESVFLHESAELESPLLRLKALYLAFLRSYTESGSLQRVLEIMYRKCEESEENRPVLELKEFWERRCREENMNLMKEAIERGELPAHLDLPLACTYLEALLDGVCMLILDCLENKKEGWESMEKILDLGLEALKCSTTIRSLS